MNKLILPPFRPEPWGLPVAKAMAGVLLSSATAGLLHLPNAWAADELLAISTTDDRANWVQFPPPKPKAVQSDRDSVAPKPPAETKPSPPVEAAKPAELPRASNQGDVGIELVGFLFVGNQAISSAELGQALASQLGMKSNMAEFDKIAEELTRYYRQKGLLARADLPQQELSTGVLRINITEAKFGGTVIADPSGAMKASDHLVRLIERQQPVGKNINLKALEKAALLAAELPGVKTQISLQPGANGGESVALVQVIPSKTKEMQIDLDNHGSRAVGTSRQSLIFNLNNPGQRGDKITANFLNSKGVKYGKLLYSLPVGDNGWRLATYGSVMHYQLITPDFNSLQAEGPSSTLGMALSVPVLQSETQKVGFNIAADWKQYRNDVFGQTISNYSGQALSLSLDAAGQDPLSPWQYRSNAAWVLGYLDLSNSTAAHIQGDAATAKTAGHFQRLRLSHFQRYALDERQALVGQFQTQFANKNLDGAEKLYLGGAQGVRAYPANEAGGSMANLLNLEYHHQLSEGPNKLMLAGFYDWGDVTVNKNSNYTTALNHYQLQGYGLWMGRSVQSGLGQTELKLTWARRIGHNPNPTSSGLDQDGSLVTNRYLFNLNHAF